MVGEWKEEALASFSHPEHIQAVLVWLRRQGTDKADHSTNAHSATELPHQPHMDKMVAAGHLPAMPAAAAVAAFSLQAEVCVEVVAFFLLVEGAAVVALLQLNPAALLQRADPYATCLQERAALLATAGGSNLSLLNELWQVVEVAVVFRPQIYLAMRSLPNEIFSCVCRYQHAL